jgi:YD repeat-containing protein
MIYIKQNKLINIIFLFACLSMFSLHAHPEAEYDIILLNENSENMTYHLDYIYNQNGLEETKLIYDETGMIISTISFTYDSEGRMIKEIDETGSGCEKEYDDKGKLLVETHYENEKILEQFNFIYDTEGNCIDVKHLNGKNENDSQTYWEWLKEMTSSASTAFTTFKDSISYSNYINNEWNQIVEALFPKSFLHFSGYYCDPIASGTTPYGQEIKDKVRVTLINGILNLSNDMDSLLQIFSRCHGNIPIHYVFRPTEGWTNDIMTSSLSKMGFTSIYAQLLANQWKRLIEEMGGVGNGGTIIHYAHSIGATETYVARNLLTLEERQMIHVITLGTPSMIPKNCGFASAINYVSRRDGVSFLLDPVGVAMGYFYEVSTIEFIGTYMGIPFIDHTLYTESYGGTINDLGIKFVETYGN